MSVYRVVVEGAPLTLHLDDEPSRMRFTVTRFVEAADEGAAMNAAARLVQEDPRIVRAATAEEREAMRLAVLDVEEVAGPLPPTQPGFAFFPLEDWDA